MGPARIYPWRKMHRSRAPSIAPDTFFVAQSWADSIIDMPGFNLRQAQGSFPVGDRIHAATSLQVVVSISKLGSQFSLQHFARRISREVRHEHKSTRNFVAAKLLPAERDKIVQRRC
jgi:hypothetical protein